MRPPARAPAKPRRTAAEQGFSLIEMLVSLALIVLLLALLPNAIGLGRRAWETHDDVGDRIAALAGLNLLQQRLGEAIPAFEADGQGNAGIAFRGEAASLAFVAPSRALSLPGLARWTVRLEPGATGRLSRLILVAQSFASNRSSDASAPVQGTEIASSVVSASFEYFGRKSPDEAPEWHAEWPRTDALPSLVAITVTPVAANPAARRIVIELKLATR